MSLLDYITHYQEAHPWIATVIGIVFVVWIIARYLMKSNDLENYKLLEERRADVGKLRLEVEMLEDKLDKERDKYMNLVHANLVHAHINKGK